MNATEFVLSNRKYDFGKKLVQVYIPATSSLYFGLAAIWGLPASEQVVGTLAVLATFLGVILGVSTKNYEESGAAYDGQLVVTSDQGGSKLFSLELDEDPDVIASMDSISFKVKEGELPFEEE